MTALRNQGWQKYIYKVAIVILVIFFVAGVGIGAKKILTIEGVRELYTAPEPLSKTPETAEEMLRYINDAIEKALLLSPKTELSSTFSVDKDSLRASGDDRQFLSAVQMAVPRINSDAAACFEKNTADFSESAAAFLTPCNIDAADVAEAELSYEYYKCLLCTAEIAYDDYSDVCPECASENTLQKRSRDTYRITLRISPDSPAFTDNPFPKAEVLSSVIAEEGGNFYALRNFDKQYNGVILYAEINRLTDEIALLRYETSGSVSADLEMTGAYASLGTVTVSADIRDRVNYKFTWPSVKLDKHETTVELGSSEALKAKLTCDDPAGYDVMWTSSDESVLTVDEQGYLKTNKVFGDSVITAAFTFKGKEYSDSCLVHVGVPAEGVDLSKGKLSLKTGDTYQLNAVFNPKDTTNTKCFWYSEDESVARVDENGLVTAVSPGRTVICIITDYGNYYSSCKTEVKD
ncbi:MAG: Ig-like domain-containing protein [Clostridia bacterium]|nr:Ig-like domain-containing protein [Clostridia bacterium]